MKISKWFALSSASILSLTASESVRAAPPADPSLAVSPAEIDSGAIVVTARKKAEDILKTPIAVTALTSADIAVRGIVSVNDIAAFTPGVNVDNDAASRNDRSFQQIVIRGFNPSAATNPTASLFIDGVPVSSPTAFTSIGDPERIEILKGPQSAYFGRNTFAGAVNVVNKVPGNVFGGSISGLLGTRSNTKAHADVEGPILGGKLTFRASFDRFSKDGSYKNSFDPGQTLGDQRTTSESLMLVAKPVDGLTIKGFGIYSTDHDGPSAQGLISAYAIKDSAGNVIVPAQSNCTLAGRSAAGPAVSNASFCGTTPNLAYAPSANTTNDAFIKNFLANPTGRLVSPDKGTKGYGLVRRYYHLHLVADYAIPDTGITLSSLTGYNNERYSVLSDIDNIGTTAIANTGTGPVPAGARSYFDYPYLVEHTTRDFSQELRASFDNGGRFHGTIGGSYLNSLSQGDLGGGNAGLGTTTFVTTAGATRNRTFGAFFGLTYKLTDKLSLTAEGRYQIDKLYAYAQPAGLVETTSAFVPAGTYAGGSTLLSKSYMNFLPRVIAQYQATRNLMFYASYSKGINPGLFNTSFLTFSPTVQRAAEAAGIGIGVAPEKVTNYEIGAKGKFFDNRLRLSVDAYYAPWRNQINAILINTPDPTTNTIQIVRGSANTGSVDMKGVEADGTFTLTHNIAFNFAGAFNGSKIKSFQNAILSQTTGITDFRGNENPLTSKFSATFGGQYNAAIRGIDDATWFARVDYVFKSGMYADAANLVKTKAIDKVNVKIGAAKGPVSFDIFATNLFNNKSYTSIADGSVLTNNFRYSTYNSALIVGLPDLRTVGVEAKFKF